MKKTLFLLLPILLLSIAVSAQTQQGYVKTKGRLAKDGTVIPGQRIPSASVILKGGNSTVSGDNGEFSLLLPESKFFLQNVQKKGYVLTDPEILSKEYNYSKNDLILVMETPGDQWDDKRAAEKAMREQLQKRVDEQREELEKLKEEQRVSDEEYRERLQRIFELYDENDKLVSEMAEEYTKIDYDQLDEYNHQIRQLILNGELQKADSLIHSKGNIDERISDLRKHQEANAKEAKTLAKRQEQLEASRSGTQKELEDIAQDCYNKFEIRKLQHLNDSAAFWIELRAELDSTNADWQNDAGKFIRDYIGDYEQSLLYYKIALRHNLSIHGNNSIATATSFSLIAEAYLLQDKYEIALDYYLKAVAIETSNNSENPGIAVLYNNIGTTYFHMGDYSSALEYANKSLTIRNTFLEKDHIDFAYNYTLISYIYLRQGNLNQSFELAEKALKIYEKRLDSNSSNIANAYNNIAIILDEQHNYDQALEYFEKSITINKEIYGEFHPSIANNYKNIGGVYLRLGDFSRAIEYLNKALIIFETLLGPIHSETAATYNLIGIVYYYQNDYSNAALYFTKALEIREKLLNHIHNDIAVSYDNLGVLYLKIGNTEKALEYMQEALNIYQIIYKEENSSIANSYDHIGVVFLTAGDYHKALEYCQHAVSIKENIDENNSTSINATYRNIGLIYNKLKNYALAIEYLEKALRIEEKQYGENHHETQYTKQELENVRQYQKANDSEEMKKLVFIATVTDDENSPARLQEMDGEYIILESNEWSIDSSLSLFETNEKQQGKPTTLVLLKENMIKQYIFENTIGVNISLKAIGIQKKEHIIEMYHQWKTNNDKE